MSKNGTGLPALSRRRASCLWMGLGVACIAAPHAWSQHASTVLRYEPGIGYATEFGTGVGYTNALAALGEPSRSTPGPFGGPVDPFSPPWQPSQVVSLGSGGLLELQLDSPIRRDAAHPFGIDFMVFGGSGFVIINGDYSGGGITDGSTFGQDPAQVRLSVADTNGPWFTLDPALAPPLEGMFPTDGSGDFTRAVNPALKPTDFNGLGLGGIRVAYGGSGGGTGFSIAWARDGSGQPAPITEATRLRLEVLSGRVEVDAVAAVQPVPEPQTIALAGAAAVAWLAWSWTGPARRAHAAQATRRPR